EVAPVGEDQHSPCLRRLDEAERRDRLAGSGGVLEPETLGGVGVLGLFGKGFSLAVLLVPVAGLLLGLFLARLLPGGLLAGAQLDLFLIVLVFLFLARRTLNRPQIVVVLLVLLVLGLLADVGIAQVGVSSRPRCGGVVAALVGILGTENVGGGKLLG